MYERLGRWGSGALIFALVLTGGCEGIERGPAVEPWPAGDASYHFDQPDAQFVLPQVLEEISGLAFLDDGTLAAVQDEDGILYILDPTDGSIIDERTFGSPGDYEALAVGAGYLFILESGGTLYRFDHWEGNTLDGTELALDLPGRCDAEGLRYDADDDRLLVSCKENSGPHLKQEKAIFAFDTSGRPLSDRPVFALDRRAFTISVEDHPVNEAVRSVLSERVDLSGFKPSDLAIHPITGEIFVLSSVREAVLSMRRDGVVTAVWKLADALLDQPEGMDFQPNGDLFISSEAGDRKHGVLLRFDYRAQPQTPSE